MGMKINCDNWDTWNNLCKLLANTHQNIISTNRSVHSETHTGTFFYYDKSSNITEIYTWIQ